MIVKNFCPVCNSKVQTTSEFKNGGLIFTGFSCGHSRTQKELKRGDFADFVSQDNKRPYPFQIDGALFALNSGGRFLIMDEMGLGKTVQFLMFTKELLKSFPKKRILLAVKSGLKIQWAKEIQRWLDRDAQIIDKEDEFVLPGVRFIIVSFDMLWRFKDIKAFVEKHNVICCGLDEVQHIKNSDSKRTKGVQILVQNVEYVGALSGTPIKNNAGEFFPVLNMIRPDKIPSKHYWERIWVDTYYNGYGGTKSKGLKDPQRFKEFSKDFIIRRTREEVMPDLPSITRENRFSELGKEVEQLYKDTFKQFQNFYNGTSSSQLSALQRNANILAYLVKMRHLTGLAKIEPTVEYVKDFIEETDRKIVIFLHHKDVAELLIQKLQEELPDERILQLSADLSSFQRNEVVETFQMPKFRIMVASTLASGEGLNLQFCSDCIIMERQWNPANEEQAEGRFVRIGQKANAVTSTYMIAVGTVDEFFSEIVEKKRSIAANVLDAKDIKWDESSLIKELAEVLAMNGGSHWSW